MKIMGIDPGLGVTGFGIIELADKNFSLVKYGFIKTSYRTKLQNRLDVIASELSAIIEKYNPKFVVLEKLYSHYKHPSTAILMGHVRGVICYLCGEHGVPVVNYSATRIKKAIVGQGNATKEQVQKMVKRFLKIEEEIRISDITDALALAIGYAFINVSNINCCESP